MAGVWNGINFDVPAQLTTMISTQGLVVDVPQSQAFGADLFQVTVQPNGTFSNGGDSGSVVVNSQGAFTVYPNGSPSLSFRANRAQDTFAGLTRNGSGNDTRNGLNLVARAPASFSAGDVAGTWSMAMFTTPQQLIKVMTTNGTLQDLLGMDGNSLTSRTFSEVGSGSMTINSDGTLSGNAGEAFTGTYTTGENGQINLTITTPEGSFGMPSLINASKDIIFALHLENANNRQEIVILTKNPTNVATADLQGVWNATSYNVPSQLTITRNTNYVITSISSAGGFNMDQGAQFTSGHDGFLTGVLEGEANIGSISAANNGTATVVFTNGLGQVQSHTGFLNAGKDCIVFADSDGGSSGITVVTKSPDWPGNTQNFGLQLFNGRIVWASNTNILLQASGTLNGTWTNVSSTLGQHQFDPAFTNAAGFYRVANQ
jgi:hypothetical protein